MASSFILSPFFSSLLPSHVPILMFYLFFSISFFVLILTFFFSPFLSLLSRLLSPLTFSFYYSLFLLSSLYSYLPFPFISFSVISFLFFLFNFFFSFLCVSPFPFPSSPSFFPSLLPFYIASFIHFSAFLHLLLNSQLCILFLKRSFSLLRFSLTSYTFFLSLLPSFVSVFMFSLFSSPPSLL